MSTNRTPAAGSTIEPRIHICRFDDERVRCSVSDECEICRNSPPSMPRFTTCSIRREAFTHDQISNSTAPPLLLNVAAFARHKGKLHWPGRDLVEFSTAFFSVSKVGLTATDQLLAFVCASPGAGDAVIFTPSLLEVVRRAGLIDNAVVLFEDIDDLLVHLAFLSHFFPEHLGSVLNLGPLTGRYRAQLQLVTVGA